MSDEKKPLAQMSPEQLAAEHARLVRESNNRKALRALIQRATQEAREGMVQRDLYVAAADFNAHCTKQRDEARAQLAEAERKLAEFEPTDLMPMLDAAKHEGAREALTGWARACDLGVARVPPSIAAEVHAIESFRDRRYPAPTPAASGTPEGVTGNVVAIPPRLDGFVVLTPEICREIHRVATEGR